MYKKNVSYMNKIIILMCLLLLGCGYPNINQIPNNLDLNITYEDRKNIEKLKKEIKNNE